MYIARDVSTKIYARGGVCIWRGVCGVCGVCGVFVCVVEGYVSGDVRVMSNQPLLGK